MNLIPNIIESWTSTDKWWTNDPIVNEYAEVDWNYCKVVMIRRHNDSVWRILDTKLV